MSALLLKSPQSLPTSPPRAAAGPAPFQFASTRSPFHREPRKNWLRALPLPTSLPPPPPPSLSHPCALRASHKNLCVPAALKTRAGWHSTGARGAHQGVPGGGHHGPVRGVGLHVRVRTVALRGKRFSQSWPRCYLEILQFDDRCLSLPSGERLWGPSSIGLLGPRH